MKYRLFAVKDKALDSFSSPFTQATVEAGVRMWRDLVMFGDQDNRYRRSPDDFSLYLIGEYDDEKGEVKNGDNVLVSSAREVLLEATAQEAK